MSGNTQRTSASFRFPSLFVQVVFATILGLLVGLFAPSVAPDVRWTTDLFLKLIVMAVGPLLFCIVALGIIGAGSLKTVGRLGGRALLYFEAMTTLVLFVSVGITMLLGAGKGIRFVPTPGDEQLVATYSGNAKHLHESGVSGFLLSLIPHTPVSAFTDGNVLQILFLAILCGCCLNQMGATAAPVITLLESLSALFSRMMRFIICLAPLGVFGAMVTTTARYGLGTVLHLASFVLLYFVMIAFFIVGVLGSCLKICGLNPIRFARYFREESAIVLTTTTSDAVLPRIMEKLEALGVERQVVGLVVPAGYSFNLDALSIYLGLAVIFLANATGTHLTFWQIGTMLVTALFTSKGAHGVPGVAIVVLAATLAAVPSIPVASLVMLLAVDWFIGIARALGNFAGNCVAPVVIGRWEKKIDLEQAKRVLGMH
ncbi:sodium:dicarboxylate symporter/C4-dicarboxylate transporter [Gluconobacter thailandicus F149-1 = NBRC 100600]|nr:cation:dicarboxylase symporter family transporter [Gluconobacter thailandicus]KXV52833.1 C4-dicarboxylate ABC transporter [Gluconobacter thailandicus]GAN93131.1 sodium:dicarboxylate symporter/C4-dicarboxylate transporter [Gluconobacter thailandicus F149-1 = NBRC 100600]GBR58610.1 C4-dicarboxylate transport protein [Gluconobacter thailandicus F149-1 = NBRC 100600]GEL86970.1 C4-dicarboxylate transporter DctA [Gluconobacter thailandicus F149-1 = NBRC 100600]